MPTDTPGERLSEVIYKKRISRKAFAKALGYNPSYITLICLNAKPLSAEFAGRVEKHFGIPASWLINGAAAEAEIPPAFKPQLKDTVISKIEKVDSEHELRAILAFIKSYEELPLLEAVQEEQGSNHKKVSQDGNEKTKPQRDGARNLPMLAPKPFKPL